MSCLTLTYSKTKSITLISLLGNWMTAGVSFLLGIYSVRNINDHRNIRKSYTPKSRRSASASLSGLSGQFIPMREPNSNRSSKQEYCSLQIKYNTGISYFRNIFSRNLYVFLQESVLQNFFGNLKGLGRRIPLISVSNRV